MHNGAESGCGSARKSRRRRRSGSSLRQSKGNPLIRAAAVTAAYSSSLLARLRERRRDDDDAGARLGNAALETLSLSLRRVLYRPRDLAATAFFVSPVFFSLSPSLASRALARLFCFAQCANFFSSSFPGTLGWFYGSRVDYMALQPHARKNVGGEERSASSGLIF